MHANNYTSQKKKKNAISYSVIIIHCNVASTLNHTHGSHVIVTRPVGCVYKVPVAIVLHNGIFGVLGGGRAYL